MKKNIYIIIISIFIVLSFWVIHTASAGNLEESRQELLDLNGGQRFVNAVDTVSAKIIEKSKQDDTFRRKVDEKISEILILYKNKRDNKSQTIYRVFVYLDSKVTFGMGISESRILTRFQKVESDKNQNRATGRKNKIKEKKYQRIHIKK